MDYNKAIVLDSNFIQAYYNRALIYQQLNNLPLALQDLDKVIQMDKADYAAYYQRGKVKIATGLHREGCDDLKIAALEGNVSEATSIIKSHCK